MRDFEFSTKIDNKKVTKMPPIVFRGIARERRACA